MNMTLGELVEATTLDEGGSVGWNEFWDTHAHSNEWATHAQVLAASSYYQRPVVTVTSMGARTVATPGVEPAAAPLFVMLSMASVLVPGRAEPLAAHHYEGLCMDEVSRIDPSSICDAVDGTVVTVCYLRVCRRMSRRRKWWRRVQP